MKVSVYTCTKQPTHNHITGFRDSVIAGTLTKKQLRGTITLVAMMLLFNSTVRYKTVSNATVLKIFYTYPHEN